MIDTILFDLNRVIVCVEKSIEDEKKYLLNFGVEKKVFWTAVLERFPEYNIGKRSFGDLLEYAFVKLGLDKSLIPVAIDLHGEALRFVEGIENILLKLATKYKLILLAGDGEESFELKWNKFNLNRFFVKAYGTYQIGLHKNDERFYKKLILEEKFDINKVVFVDDQESYIETALKVGIKGILFENSEKLLQQFGEYGIFI